MLESKFSEHLSLLNANQDISCASEWKFPVESDTTY